MGKHLLSADNLVLRIGATVYIRIVGAYPIPGRWRVSKMTVVRETNTRLRLERGSGKTGCWRKPTEVFISRDAAKGSVQP